LFKILADKSLIHEKQFQIISNKIRLNIVSVNDTFDLFKTLLYIKLLISKTRAKSIVDGDFNASLSRTTHFVKYNTRFF